MKGNQPLVGLYRNHSHVVHQQKFLSTKETTTTYARVMNTVSKPDKVDELLALLKKQIKDGRSTPGAQQSNDVEVRIEKQK